MGLDLLITSVNYDESSTIKCSWSLKDLVDNVDVVFEVLALIKKTWYVHLQICY